MNKQLGSCDAALVVTDASKRRKTLAQHHCVTPRKNCRSCQSQTAVTEAPYCKEPKVHYRGNNSPAPVHTNLPNALFFPLSSSCHVFQQNFARNCYPFHLNTQRTAACRFGLTTVTNIFTPENIHRNNYSRTYPRIYKKFHFCNNLFAFCNSVLTSEETYFFSCWMGRDSTATSERKDTCMTDRHTLSPIFIYANGLHFKY